MNRRTGQTISGIRAMTVLAVLGVVGLAVVLIQGGATPVVEAQESGCRGYNVCITKQTIPDSNVNFPFIIDIENLTDSSVEPKVDGAYINQPTTVYLSDGDSVGIQFRGEARVTEVPVQGWELVDIRCEGNGEYGWRVEGNTLEIYYAFGTEGAYLNCTFVNQRTQPLNLGGLFAGQPTPLPTARPAAVAPAATAPTTISPPRTGDGGLK